MSGPPTIVIDHVEDELLIFRVDGLEQT
jgi:hypothetical protein